MVSTYLFVAFLVFLFVSLSLILGLGLVNREEQRAAEELASGEAAAPARRGRSVDDLVAQLEEFIRKEAKAVSAFVSAPSVGGLLGDASGGAASHANGENAQDPS